MSHKILDSVPVIGCTKTGEVTSLSDKILENSIKKFVDEIRSRPMEPARVGAVNPKRLPLTQAGLFWRYASSLAAGGIMTMEDLQILTAGEFEKSGFSAGVNEATIEFMLKNGKCFCDGKIATTELLKKIKRS